MKTLLQNARCIVTCDDNDSILRGADVLMQDGIITAVGKLGQVQADEVVDASRMILYPGLINTHHHLYQYFTRNLRHVQNLELFDWLTALYDIWAHLNEDTVRLSSLAGMGELMKYGCTTCFDHHYVFPNGSGDLLGAQFSAADSLGMRMVSSRGSMSLSRKDGGLPPDSVVQTTEEILRDSRNAIERYHDASDFSMRQVVLAPCSPFSVTADLMRESAKLARSYGVRLHTHLCETMDEERYTVSTRGMRPLAYMETVDFVGSDVHYAHGIFFNDEELKLLADTGTGVAHCPCSNMKLSSGVARIPDMLRLDVPVGLAVDGSASNDASNLMQEMRAAYLMHRLHSGANAPSGYDLLKLATRGSARVLGRSKLGKIAPGCAADLFAIRYDRLEMVGAERDEANLFGTVGYNQPADAVWVAGRLTVKEGQLVNIDEDRTAAQSRAEIDRLLSSAAVS